MIISENAVRHPHEIAFPSPSHLVVSQAKSKTLTKPLSKQVQSWYCCWRCRLSQLSVKARQTVLTETSSKFVPHFREILRRHQDYSWRSVIAITSDAAGVSFKVEEQREWKKEAEEKEALLYGSIRIFSDRGLLNSITVSPKLVENVGALMDCLKTISDSKAFLDEASPPKSTQQKNGKEKKGGKSREVPKVENLPQWFSPTKGGTIYEWICAFLEQLITTKYHQHANSVLQNSSRAQLYAPPSAFSEFKNLAAFWKTLNQSDKLKVFTCRFS